MHWLGIKYRVSSDNKIVITDMSLLLKGLEKYQNEAMKIRNIKSGKKVYSKNRERRKV